MPIELLTNKQILMKTNTLSYKPIVLDEGSILTFENSDIAFHYDTIMSSLNEEKKLLLKLPSLVFGYAIDRYKTIYTHKSPYDKTGKWKPKTVKMMYLLTKSVNENVIKLLQLDIPRFLAISITGMGGSEIEPNVPRYEKTFEDIQKIISLGFDVEDIVIRIDPIYPGINTNKDLLTDIITKTHNLGIRQIYTSIFDIYKSTPKKMLLKLNRKAYSKRNIKDNVLHANNEYLKSTFEAIDDDIYSISNGEIEHILCGEIPEVIPKHAKKVGCLNKERIEKTLLTKVLNIRDRELTDKNIQRQFCLCAITDKGKKLKRQGLTHEHKCAHNCLGCYVSKNSKKY